MTNLHLCPLAPHLGQLVNGLEVNLRGLVEDLPSAVQITLRFAGSPTLFVELREVDVQTMEISRSSAGVDCRKSLVVSLYNLRRYGR